MRLRASYLHRLGDALSQLGNVALLNGDANESISARSYREGKWGRVTAIDLILGEGHCRDSYIADLARAIEEQKRAMPADVDDACRHHRG